MYNHIIRVDDEL
jgi:RNase H-fold protein (predicted Holliday junction resolvase)